MQNWYPFLWISFVVILLIGAVLLFLLSKFYKVKPGVLPYVRAPLLTDTERRFFEALSVVL